MAKEKFKSTAGSAIEITSMSEVDKIDLIKKFQRIEGNLDCCASAFTKVCKQYECLWREECRATLHD